MHQPAPKSISSTNDPNTEVSINTLDSSLALHFLTIMRDKNTSSFEFNYALDRLSEILAQEVMHHYPLDEISVDTPLETTTGYRINSSKIVLVPILRAGIGLLSGFRKYLPDAQVAFIAQTRDENTHQPTKSYENIPDLKDKYILILDPMLATGGSAVNTIKHLISLGASEEKVHFISIVSSPEGITHLMTSCPDINAFTIDIDRELNENRFILPGLGDAGDRQFNTQRHSL